jgi:hypothetical protein
MLKPKRMGAWHFRILKIVTRGILEYLKLCLRINGPRMQQLKQLKEMTVCIFYLCSDVQTSL